MLSDSAAPLRATDHYLTCTPGHFEPDIFCLSRLPESLIVTISSPLCLLLPLQPAYLLKRTSKGPDLTRQL